VEITDITPPRNVESSHGATMAENLYIIVLLGLFLTRNDEVASMSTTHVNHVEQNHGK